MTDFSEPISLHDATGTTVSIPLVNLLRITAVYLFPMFLEYQEEKKDSTITGFHTWIKEKLDMGQGKQVLL